MPTHGAGPARSAQEVAASAVRAWQGLAERLTPIIGERGFLALYGCSLHITQRDFPWMALTQSGADASAHAFLSLEKSLQNQHPARAENAHRVLLTTFIALLDSLIGEQLTARLVHESRDDGAFAGRSQEPSNDR